MEVPLLYNKSPIDLSKPEDIIIYIVIPLVFVNLWFFTHGGRKKK